MARVILEPASTRDEYLLAHARKVAAALPELTDEQAGIVRSIFAEPASRSEAPSLPEISKGHPVPPRRNLLPKPISPFSAGVYFVRAGDMIKIGTSLDISGRVAALRTGSPVPIELLAVAGGSYAEEGTLHERFAHLRQHGEWFTAAPDLLAYIAQIGQP